MKITYATKRQEVTSEFVASAERKLKKFDKFFKDDATALIKTDKKRGFESVELTISCGGTLYRSEKRAETMMNALDETIEAILRQIRKNKTRLEKKLKEGAFVPAPEEETPAVLLPWLEHEGLCVRSGYRSYLRDRCRAAVVVNHHIVEHHWVCLAGTICLEFLVEVSGCVGHLVLCCT